MAAKATKKHVGPVVNVNTATEARLRTVMSLEAAAKIAKHRKEVGGYKTIPKVKTRNRGKLVLTGKSRGPAHRNPTGPMGHPSQHVER